MRLLLKLLLALSILVVGTYATTPLWLPLVLARQLPAGFQLDSFEASYPGVSAIHIKALSVSGDIASYNSNLSATDIQFNYKEWKTDIGSVTIDVDMQTAKAGATDSLSLDDLSLPVTKLTTFPPELTIHDLQFIIHHGMDFEAGNIRADDPLALRFQSVRLLHQANDTYHLGTGISANSAPELIGRLDIDVSSTSLKARLRFPYAADTPPWLEVSIEQTDEAVNTTTLFQALFDAGATGQEWPGAVIERFSGGHFNHLDGTLGMEALFAGHEVQHIEYLALTPGQLRTWSDKNSLDLDGRFLARRENEQITVTLQEPADIHYEDRDGWMDKLFEIAVPGLQLQRKALAHAHAVIDTNSTIFIQTGSDFSMAYRGGFGLDISAPGRDLNIRTSAVQIDAVDFSGMDSVTAQGLVRVKWEESGTFTYLAQGLDLKVDGMSISAEFATTGEKILSNGNGTIRGGEITSMVTSATRTDISWQQLDPLLLTGDFTVKTTGFRTEFDNETWSGFDPDIKFSLDDNSDVRGTGSIQIESGPSIPIEFEGNVISQQWDVTLPANSIKLVQLRRMLSVAHMDLPEPIRLTGGLIDMQGKLVLDDRISASVSIKGHDIGGSLHESRASNAAFSLDASYDNTLQANGPFSIGSINLAGGIEVTGVSADLDIETIEKLTLHHLAADLFDGQLTVAKLRYSDGTVDDTTIKLEHINLGQLLAFADIDGLKGTGFLALSLPMGADQTGIYIKDGSFNSSGPGSLVYKQEGIASGNIGLQALENFQYKDLSGTIDYQSDGAYRIGVHLEGNNPDLYDGHPIKFNLNITGSLPELFEALFMTGKFEESILKQIGVK